MEALAKLDYHSDHFKWRQAPSQHQLERDDGKSSKAVRIATSTTTTPIKAVVIQDYDSSRAVDATNKQLLNVSIPKEINSASVESLRKQCDLCSQLKPLYKSSIVDSASNVTSSSNVASTTASISATSSQEDKHGTSEKNFSTALKWKSLFEELLETNVNQAEIHPDTIEIFNKVLDKHGNFVTCDLGENDTYWNEFLTVQKVCDSSF